MSDLQEETLDVIYRADGALLSTVEVFRALRARGHEIFSGEGIAIIRTTVETACAVGEKIQTRVSDGRTTYQWVGSHFGARRSLANRYAAH
jgi:hypothetical protein